MGDPLVTANAATDKTVVLDEIELQIRIWGSGIPEIVLLHDGLGSISQWRDFPKEIATQTGKTVLAYDRPGHGASSPVPTGAWPADWMAEQSVVLDGLLEALDIERAILIGHSDGGSIALMLAASEQDRVGVRVGVVVALAAHSFVETVCRDAIAELHQDPESLLVALGRHHDDAAATFEAWAGGWLQPGFQEWDIRPQLAKVECPVLVVQGSEDEFATEGMYHQTLGALESCPMVEGQLLRGAHHGLPRENPDLVLRLIVDFVERVRTTFPSS